MAKKKIGDEKSEITIHYIGNNSQDVTGSCILIKTRNRKILLECGMVQSCGNPLDDFKINSYSFPFKPKDIDYVFLNHSHIDHSGRIPKLINNGFNGKIITSHITGQLLKPMLMDSCKIISGDAKFLSKQKGKLVLPFYDKEDIYNTLNLVYEYDYNQIYELDSNISFRFLHNSHIIGALQLELFIKNSLGITKSILYTSDLGSFKVKNHYVDDSDMGDKYNLVISECTYGKKTQETAPNRDKDCEKLKTIIREICSDKHGRLLIPVFSLSRSQEILTTLYELYGTDSSFKIPIIVDSPLILEINKVYRQVLQGKNAELFDKVCNWSNVKFIKSVEESNACIMDKSPKIVLSSSGFLIRGRSCDYLKQFINKENDCIVSVGFSPETSVFGKIKNGYPNVKIDKREYKVKCSCITLNSFSSHIPRHELLSYMKSLYTDKYILVHGEEQAKQEFKIDLENELSKMCRTSIVQCATKDGVSRL
jgi:metallo-beta-lactamase family protein